MDQPPYIKLPEDRPALFAVIGFDDEVGALIKGLLETLLRRESTLTVGEREILAAIACSILNCRFLADLHRLLAFRNGFEAGDTKFLSTIKWGFNPKLKALGDVLEDTIKRYTHCLDRSIKAAKVAGATDKEIFEVIAIASAMLMISSMVIATNSDIGFEEDLHNKAVDFVMSNGYIYEVSEQPVI